MNILKQAYDDLKKYREFMMYSIKSELKVNLTETYLGYIWWLLDPLMYMLVYILVVSVIFGRGDKNFPVFVFCALLSWKWTSTTITTSTSSIKSRSGLLHQIYIPKFLLPLIKNITNSVYYIFGLSMLLVLIGIYKIPFTLHIFEFVPIFFVQFMFLYGLGTILAHLGVYFRDINNILTFSLRLWFYLSPSLYTLDRIPEKIRFLWWFNPMTTFYTSYRNIFMHGISPLYKELGIWLCVSIILMATGLKFLYKFDKNYTKVI
ncbi:ABC transporter permease [Anaeromicrobium sediminis]|uniref:Transport permease protein n=1 Tax=Anaeromicrobium sediminis TaxID=1478221 RepID=A0A267MFB4_9FIRM|nr:ABC transporter permease [Anaeromicrobium sediminis]PAB58274.1 ABC transporter [Anaeromicrobium sediminis]